MKSILQVLSVFLLLIFSAGVNYSANNPAPISGEIKLTSGETIQFTALGGIYDDDYLMLTDNSAKGDYTEGSEIRVELLKVKIIKVGKLQHYQKKFRFSGNSEGNRDKTIECSCYPLELTMIDDSKHNLIAIPDGCEWACGNPTGGVFIYAHTTGIRRKIPISAVSEIILQHKKLEIRRIE